jgi:hypothetical protein
LRLVAQVATLDGLSIGRQDVECDVGDALKVGTQLGQQLAQAGAQGMTGSHR